MNKPDFGAIAAGFFLAFSAMAVSLIFHIPGAAWLETFSVVGTLISGVGSLAVALFANAQIKLSRRANERLEERFVEERRPWIDIVAVKQMHPHGICIVEIRNIGRSPAFDVRLEYSTERLEKVSKASRDGTFDGVAFKANAAPTEGMILLPQKSYDFPIDLEEAIPSQMGPLDLRLIVWVTYRWPRIERVLNSASEIIICRMPHFDEFRVASSVTLTAEMTGDLAVSPPRQIFTD